MLDNMSSYRITMLLSRSSSCFYRPRTEAFLALSLWKVFPPSDEVRRTAGYRCLKLGIELLDVGSYRLVVGQARGICKSVVRLVVIGNIELLEGVLVLVGLCVGLVAQ